MSPVDWLNQESHHRRSRYKFFNSLLAHVPIPKDRNML